MSHSYHRQLVFTLKDRCRVCFTCVRECPVKAIKIINGQAEVLNDRCIGCGNCVKVCSQGAKIPLNSITEVEEMLASENPIAACIAPSFPAEFEEVSDYRILVGMIRKIGFNYVTEVSFGADLVALEYEKRMKEDAREGDISSDCPAIVYFIRHYHPEMVPYLAPIASPMVAMNRVMKKKHGEGLKVVFIGPCFAKKAEAEEVDEVLTFQELRSMFRKRGITPANTTPSEFDPPYSGKGSIFPISRGLYYTANSQEAIPEERVVIAEGRVNFKEAIKEFEEGYIRDKHLMLLCCEGCIMGPGTSSGGMRFSRSAAVGEYVAKKLKSINEGNWKKELELYSSLDLSQSFSPEDRRLTAASEEALEKALQGMGKYSVTDHLNCGACGYDTCIDHANAIVKGLAETEMCLPYTIEKLHDSITNLNVSNEKLAKAKAALKQSEKLAHMGQLSAGIAHELNNPLGVITMYSSILMDEAPEGAPVRDDLKLIVEQADRCKKIVSGLLNFARKNQVNLSETDVVKFLQHSINSIIKPDNITINIEPAIQDPIAALDIDQMMQVLTNLEKNAVEAMPAGGQLTVSVEGDKEEISFLVKDTGTGIAKENMDKLFTPFFTTKEMGKGTGLGLALIYGIVKMHKGKIHVDSNDDPAAGPTGTTFRITLPRGV
ncbi:MAG TPA: [Fe-Fe] hydrogenase large subunit C-terminal domain-containing protein [Bacteroidales bacterium]|nr:[Fe-Fe] hydrogenase large subunit C-terminal domain-containing protein [Bacteroidales bacterium]HPT09831.1 [Fe-Fe] hydrogenase large subunit C-terminal domain-containing protein [Bacteroidales bacterium]